MSEKLQSSAWRPERLVSLSLYCLAIAAVGGVVIGVMGMFSNQWIAAGLGFAAAAISAGAVLNAMLRQ